MLGRFGNEAKFIEHYACISDGSSCRAFYKLQFDVVYESKVSKTSLPLVFEHNITTTGCVQSGKTIICFNEHVD